MADDLSTTMDALLACLCGALEDAGRPVCSWGTTVGPPVVGPAQCCKCDGAEPGGQLTVHLERMYPVDGNSLEQVTRFEECRPGAVAADLGFTLARCHPTLDNKGNSPTLDQVAPYADGLADDIQTLWNAIVCCTGYKTAIRETGVDSDPEGGCSAIGVLVTVLVKPTTPVVDVS